jgi:hypothetical protein
MAELDDMALELLNGRHYATIATQNEGGGIHMATVSFLYLDGKLLVATVYNTRKVRNIEARGKASLMVDVRRIGDERGVTAIGTATTVTGERSHNLNLLIYRKYFSDKALQDRSVMSVFESADDATIILTPESWALWDLRSMYADVFHGVLSTETGYVLPHD